MFYTFFNFVFARFTIFFRSIHILHRLSHVMFVRFCRSAWSVTSCVYSYCVIRCAYRHPASVTYMLSHFIHLPQCSLSFTSFYVYCAVFYRAPSAMSFYSNIVTTTQAGSACSVDARPALVPIFIWSRFLAPNFFLTGFSFLLRLLPSGFCRRESISTGCCRDTITGKCKLFYFLCQPIQQSGYHLIHPRLFQLCFKLITGSYKFMLIILTFFHIFHICKSLSPIFPYVKCKQDTFRVICLLLS